MIAKWRKEADISGRFPSIGSSVPQMLDPEVCHELRDITVADLDEMLVGEMRQLAKIVGRKISGRKAELKGRLQPVLQSIAGM